MAESHVVSGLVAKRSELAGKIDYHQNIIKQIRANMVAVDTAIKVFEPDYKIASIRSRQNRIANRFFRHGESNTLLMDLIREAGCDISTANIVKEAAKRKSVDISGVDRRPFTASIFTVLKRLQSKGVIEEADRVDSVIVWRMV